jgi:hypothetical protein
LTSQGSRASVALNAREAIHMMRVALLFGKNFSEIAASR